MNPSMQKKLHEIKKKYEEKLLAVCPITGIAITLNVPACIATMEYRNPLADMKNILSLLESTTDLPNLPIDIIAGTFLAVMKRRGLLDCRLMAIEQNVLLQAVPPTLLIKGILILAKVTKEQAFILPQFSVESQLHMDESRKETSLALSVGNYINNISHAIYPQQYLDSSRTVTTTFTTSTTVKIVKAKTVLTVEIKGTIKKLLSSLIEENVASSKLIELLKLSVQGENLLSLMAKDGLGNKVIAALERYATPTSIELAMSLKGIAKNLTVQDSAKQLFIKDLVNVSDTALSKPKLSLKEILATKLAPKTATPTESLQLQLPTASDEEIDRLEAILNKVSTEETGEEEKEEKRLFAGAEEEGEGEENEPI